MNYVKSFQLLYSDACIFDWRYPHIKGSYTLNSRTGEIKLIVENALPIATFTQWFTETLAYRKVSLQIIDENDAPQVIHFCMATDFSKIADQDRSSTLRYEIVFQQSKVTEAKEYNQLSAIDSFDIESVNLPLSTGTNVYKGITVQLKPYVNPAYISLLYGTGKKLSAANPIAGNILNVPNGTYYIFAVSNTTPSIYECYRIDLNNSTTIKV